MSSPQLARSAFRRFSATTSRLPNTNMGHFPEPKAETLHEDPFGNRIECLQPVED
jgi:hypothetical protein